MQDPDVQQCVLHIRGRPSLSSFSLMIIPIIPIVPSCTVLLPQSPFFHNRLTLTHMEQADGILTQNFVSIRQAVRLLEHRLTHTWTGGTDSMTSTADVGGNKIRLKDMILTHSYSCNDTIPTQITTSSNGSTV